MNRLIWLPALLAGCPALTGGTGGDLEPRVADIEAQLPQVEINTNDLLALDGIVAGLRADVDALDVQQQALQARVGDLELGDGVSAAADTVWFAGQGTDFTGAGSDIDTLQSIRIDPPGDGMVHVLLHARARYENGSRRDKIGLGDNDDDIDFFTFAGLGEGTIADNPVESIAVSAMYPVQAGVPLEVLALREDTTDRSGTVSIVVESMTAVYLPGTLAL